ncbi:hypothetical protein CEXT_401811 [Caerostris extrusa]|uniref:Uncharacterized protein n=1 Tax=Caerostris extrusa TaxID=172846 RepID=A0AAV4MUB2_CAEEX|nr:hypothetical protein CEXT_401811 [Caerostris extrusa]
MSARDLGEMCEINPLRFCEHDHKCFTQVSRAPREKHINEDGTTAKTEIDTHLQKTLLFRLLLQDNRGWRLLCREA